MYRNQNYYPDGKVAVIKDGVMHVYSHKTDHLNPSKIAKLEPGAVIGHHSDNGLTTDSENWIVNYSEGTELIIFDK